MSMRVFQNQEMPVISDLEDHAELTECALKRLDRQIDNAKGRITDRTLTRIEFDVPTSAYMPALLTIRALLVEHMSEYERAARIIMESRERGIREA